MNDHIHLFRPYLPESAKNRARIQMNERFIGQGPLVDEFEQQFETQLSHSHKAIAVNSGTSALHLSYILAGIKDGDLVIGPVFTCSATFSGLLFQRARPVFADINKGNLNINPDHVEELLNQYDGHVKAIITVDYAGNPCNYDRLLDLAKKWNIPLIQDAAQSIGATYKGKNMGEISPFTAFSFQAIKSITTCFLPTAKIIIPRIGKNGSMSKQIKNIIMGDEVITFDEKTSQKVAMKVVNKMIRKYKGNIIKLTLSNFNEIEATEEHPVFVIGRGWTPIQDIQVGDKLLQYKYYGLKERLFGKMSRGKKVEEIFGHRKGSALRKMHSNLLKGKKHFNYGKKLDLSVRNKIALGNTGKKISDEQKQEMSIRMKNFWSIEKNREQLNETLKKKFIEHPEITQKISNKSKKYFSDIKNRKKMSVLVKRMMLNPEYWKHYFEGVNRKPNKSELVLQNIIDQVSPNEFKYNGDFSLGVTLNGLVPDFVNINGKKKVIELFGTYWHSEEVRGQKIENQIEQKQDRYRSVGFESLFILEEELKDREKLENKIETFIYNPNTEIVKVEKIEKYSYEGNVYNIETKTNHNYFVYGILVHNCDGGMLTIEDPMLEEKAKRIRWFGIDRKAKFEDRWKKDIWEVGFKYQMTDIEAAMGLEGLKELPNILSHQKELFETYKTGLSGISGIQLLYGTEEGAIPSYWICTVQVENREELKRKLAENEIESDPVHYRCDRYTIYGGRVYNCPNMDALENKYLVLPMHHFITKETIQYISDIIKGGW